MANNLSDKQQMVLDYLRNSLSETVNPHEMRDEGVFTEMFLSPQLDILAPLLDYLDTIRLSQSLDNAMYISQERLDEIGRTFNNERIYGTQSQGYATFVFDDIPDSGYITIPKGIVLTTRSGLRFTVNASSMYDELTIAQHYDPSSYLYKIPVKVTSEGVGRSYNIIANEISDVEGTSLRNLIGVTNDIAFIGGEDTETNEEYARRLREEQGAPNLGVQRGYERMLRSFREVEDQVVVGYRHPLMRRDVIGNVEIPGVKLHEGIQHKHWGSKVDLYVRGEKQEEITESYVLEEDSDGRLFVQLKNSPIVGVRNIFMSTENAGFDPEEVDFERLLIDRFSVVRDEDFETFGTIEEDCKIYFEKVQSQGFFELYRGAIVDINYVLNKLPSDITDYMYNSDEENRPPVADVKVKLSRKKFVVVSLVVGLNGGSMQVSDELAVKNHLELGVRDVDMGGELQVSDLVERVYNQSGFSQMNNIDYIDLPFHFLTFEHHNVLLYECLSEEKKNKFVSNYIPDEFKNHVDYYKENLTIQEFLTVLYILSRNSPITNSDDAETQLKFERYRILQHAYEGAGTPKVLSPVVAKTSEIEHFELSNIRVEESKKLTEEDWLDFDYMIRSLSQKEDSEVNVEALTLFVIIISLIANDAENIDERVFNAIKILSNVEELIDDEG